MSFSWQRRRGIALLLIALEQVSFAKPPPRTNTRPIKKSGGSVMTSRLALCATVAATVLFATGVGALAQTYEVTKIVPGSAFHGVHRLRLDKARRLLPRRLGGSALDKSDHD